jgi:G6PDH family F420-dependent oxidoreductase
MTTYGYTLLGEEHGPRELVTIARRAEEAGFDFLAASDHYHPWVPEQHHSPYTWSVLGAVAAVTERVDLATMVTCPIMRYHPAVVAQKAATMSVLTGGRFTLGIGAGEQLNEHVVGGGWPPVDVRHEMLAEAVEIFRLLWQGGYQSFQGRYYTVEDARIFDIHDPAPPIAVAASGPASAGLAGSLGDGMIAIAPDEKLVDHFEQAGGQGRPVWGQIAVCWGDDREAALRLAHERFRWVALGWKAMSELPNPVNFAQATSAVTPDALAGKIPHGPDPEDYLQAVQAYTDAGYDRIAFYQIGDNQEGFLHFWQRELEPQLRETGAVAAR